MESYYLMLLFTIYIALFATTKVSAYSTGPPTSVCSSLTPNHGGSSGSGNGGYIISVSDTLPIANSGEGFTYQSGTSYVIRIEKNETGVVDFKGFAIQAVEANSTNLLGTFSDPGSNRRYLNCAGSTMATITHSAAVSRTMEEFTWTAPTGNSGDVDFRYTVVQTRPVYYAALLASADNFDTHNMSSSPPSSPPSSTTGAAPGTQQPSNTISPNTTSAQSKALKTKLNLLFLFLTCLYFPNC